MSKAGKGYTSASGGTMGDYGGRLLMGRTERKEGFQISIKATDARDNLASFPKIVDEGNDIILSKKKGCYQ